MQVILIFIKYSDDILGCYEKKNKIPDWVKSNFLGLCLISSFLGLRNSATLIGLSCTRCLFVNLSNDPLSSLSSSISFLLQGSRFPWKMDTLLGSSFFKGSLDWVAFWLCDELTWVFGEVLDSQVFMEGDTIGDTRDSLPAFMLEINVWLDFSTNFGSRPSADTPAKQFIINLWWNCQITILTLHYLLSVNLKKSSPLIYLWTLFTQL